MQYTYTQNDNIQTIQKKLSLSNSHQFPFEMKFSVHYCKQSNIKDRVACKQNVVSCLQLYQKASS